SAPWFWPEWYNTTYKPAADFASVLDHYIQVGRKKLLNPNPYFDAHFYLQTNPDLAGQDIDPLLHYLSSGHSEARNPGQLFDQDFYTNNSTTAKDGNPFSEFLRG